MSPRCPLCGAYVRTSEHAWRCTRCRASGDDGLVYKLVYKFNPIDGGDRLTPRKDGEPD